MGVRTGGVMHGSLGLPRCPHQAGVISGAGSGVRGNSGVYRRQAVLPPAPFALSSSVPVPPPLPSSCGRGGRSFLLRRADVHAHRQGGDPIGSWKCARRKRGEGMPRGPGPAVGLTSPPGVGPSRGQQVDRSFPQGASSERFTRPGSAVAPSCRHVGPSVPPPLSFHLRFDSFTRPRLPLPSLFLTRGKRAPPTGPSHVPFLLPGVLSSRPCKSTSLDTFSLCSSVAFQRESKPPSVLHHAFSPLA